MDSLVHIQGSDDTNLTPLFLVHAISGLSIPYLHLNSLTSIDRHGQAVERPVYGINSPVYTAEDVSLPPSFEALAALYVEEIKKVQPNGPYLLGGWSFGGMVAIKLAQVLLAQGETVSRVIMLDSPNPETFPAFKSKAEHEALTEATYSQTVAKKLAFSAVGDLLESPSESDISDEDEHGDGDDLAAARQIAQLTRKHIAEFFLLLSKQEPGSFLPEKLDADVFLIKCKTVLRIDSTTPLNRSAYMLGLMRDKLMNWDPEKFRSFECIEFSGDHYGSFDAQYVDELSDIFRLVLQGVE
ncbi:beta-ketoacyl synthase [Nemania serpens]|nr:beta-ketoacyl synthase [Nemania serpens]